LKSPEAINEALQGALEPKSERTLAIVFHQNGLSTVPARLIAPGSRLVGFGPTNGEKLRDKRINNHVFHK